MLCYTEYLIPDMKLKIYFVTYIDNKIDLAYKQNKNINSAFNEVQIALKLHSEKRREICEKTLLNPFIISKYNINGT